jgi:hypothetical protein
MINITKYSSWISITIGIWMGLHTVNLSAQSCSAIWIQHKGDSFVNIINSSGQILFTGEFVDNVEINLPNYTGLIIIHVGNSSCSHVKKFTVFN